MIEILIIALFAAFLSLILSRVKLPTYILAIILVGMLMIPSTSLVIFPEIIFENVLILCLIVTSTIVLTIKIIYEVVTSRHDKILKILEKLLKKLGITLSTEEKRIDVLQIYEKYLESRVYRTRESKIREEASLNFLKNCTLYIIYDVDSIDRIRSIYRTLVKDLECINERLEVLSRVINVDKLKLMSESTYKTIHHALLGLEGKVEMISRMVKLYSTSHNVILVFNNYELVGVLVLPQ